MENGQQIGNIQSGCCGSHMGCSHKRWVCWVLGLVVLIIVFCTGYKLGVLRGYLGSWGHMGGYGRPMMMYRTGSFDNFGPGMMGNVQYRAEVLEDQITTTPRQ